MNRVKMTLLATEEGRYAADQAVEWIKAGVPAVEVAVRASMMVEEDIRIPSVGKGSPPDIYGEVTLDACVIDGTTRLTSAVAGIKGILYASQLAQSFLGSGFTLLVNQGAESLAGRDHAELLTPSTKAEYEKRKSKVPAELRDKIDKRTLNMEQYLACLPYMQDPVPAPPVPNDTVAFIVIDKEGHSGTCVSTAGMNYKPPGRVGDSGVCGAGSYVGDGVGGAAFTWTGEMAQRILAAKGSFDKMKAGQSARSATIATLKEAQALKGGKIGALAGHALEYQSGEAFVGTINLPTYNVIYSYWIEGMPRAEILEAVRVDDIN